MTYVIGSVVAALIVYVTMIWRKPVRREPMRLLFAFIYFVWVFSGVSLGTMGLMEQLHDMTEPVSLLLIGIPTITCLAIVPIIYREDSLPAAENA